MVPEALIHPSPYTKVTIKAVKEEAQGVKSFILEPDSPLPYKEGQFITFVFEGAHGEERRSYSMSSSPRMEEPLTIAMKRVENGRYSRPLIDDAVPGDVLFTSGISGQFTLPSDLGNYTQLFFFAAGIGITPIYSLIKAALATHSRIKVILFYSNRSFEDAVFYDELLQLHKQFPKQLSLEFLFSSSLNLSRARLSKWLLPQRLQQYAGGEKAKQLFYTCGPIPYMRMVQLSLEELGYNKDQIRKEIFDITKPALKLAPPDKEAHEVYIELNGSSYSFKAQYPDTILQAAKKNNIILPYSCETGRCASCLMQCGKGKVWMSYNEVLTEKDILLGKVLTCVGHPISGDVELRFPE